MTAIKPARVDANLVKSFERAAASGGRVSENEVKTLIATHMKDGGKLTDVEKATIAWAVEEFQFTPAAKRALSDEITALTGQPIFEWQRELKGPLGVRLGDQLTKGELDKKAALAFQQNTVAFGSEWGDAFFNHPESGNSGTHVRALEGNAAEQYLKFLAYVNDDAAMLDRISPKTHAIYSVYESDDEEHFGGILVDRKTGEAVAVDDFNIVDVSSTLSREQFEEVFGVVKNADGERASDAEYDEALYDVDVGETLGRGEPGIELPNFGAAQVARRDGPLNKAAQALREGLEAGTARTAGWNYGTMARTDGLALRMPMIMEEIHSADWRDNEKRGDPGKVIENLRPLDDAGRAALLATVRAVNPDLSADKVNAFVAAMGNAADLRFAVVESPMTMRVDNNNSVEFTTKAIVLVNEKEGDWMAIYDREKRAGD
jgi:hypothetical protein